MTLVVNFVDFNAKYCFLVKWKTSWFREKKNDGSPYHCNIRMCWSGRKLYLVPYSLWCSPWFWFTSKTHFPSTILQCWNYLCVQPCHHLTKPGWASSHIAPQNLNNYDGGTLALMPHLSSFLIFGENPNGV